MGSKTRVIRASLISLADAKGLAWKGSAGGGSANSSIEPSRWRISLIEFVVPLKLQRD